MTVGCVTKRYSRTNTLARGSFNDTKGGDLGEDLLVNMHCANNTEVLGREIEIDTLLCRTCK